MGSRERCPSATWHIRFFARKVRRLEEAERQVVLAPRGVVVDEDQGGHAAGVPGCVRARDGRTAAPAAQGPRARVLALPRPPVERQLNDEVMHVSQHL